MAGTSNRGAATDDWMLLTPSPRTLMLSFWNDDFRSGPFLDISGDNGNNKPQDGIDKSKTLGDPIREETGQVAKAPLQFEPTLFGANEKSSSNGSLAERIGGRNGFCSLKIDTCRVGSSASIRSPVTIPPGVSPRELLESPVFLPTTIVQPSPTTGKLPFFMCANANPTMSSVPKKAEDLLHDDCAFSFQPILRSKPPSFSIADRGSTAIHQNQSSADDNQQELSLQCSSTAAKGVTNATFAKHKTSDSMFDNDNPIPANEQEESETNQNGDYSSAPIITPDEDGYNWRKYGQKQVKNSEHPRSYYKCTHPNCPVKKKVERSQDGHITEIVYKGSHNHPLPPPNRRPSVPFSYFNDLQADGSEKFSSMPGLNTETSPGNVPDGHLQDEHGEVLKTRLSASLNTAELAGASVAETREAVDALSTLSNEEDNRGTHGAVSLGCDGDGDESESKRRKMDSVTPTTAISSIDIGAMVASRAVQEPRVIVQTTSEVDILDDGYRWRKYGQKVVKGNPNPRSYYKCTHPGCSVRKHVERASNDLKSVITTYEGKHNHEVPAARNSRQPSSGPGAALPAVPQANGPHQRPEPAQGRLAQFGSASAYGSQFGAAGGFSFGMLPHSMAVQVPSLGTVIPAQMAGHPPAMQGYPGLVLPIGGVKVNPVAPSGLPVANGTAYQQLMDRLSQGPQM